ncbi:MAG: hypothetical protein ACJAZ9_001589 [Neolewinella sp.]
MVGFGSHKGTLDKGGFFGADAGARMVIEEQGNKQRCFLLATKAIAPQTRKPANKSISTIKIGGFNRRLLK